MEKFRTVVKIEKPAFEINYSDALVNIGSCFSENIGQCFKQNKFNMLINPFGQQYNPVSIANGLLRLLNPVHYQEKDLVFQDGLYHSFDHHGSFSRSAIAETLEVVNAGLASGAAQLKNSKVLFLTFGSAHVFRLKENGAIVSNCHKIAGTKFTQELLSVEDIVGAISNALQKLWEVNKNINVVLTVSPVRYFAYGYYENSVSKGHLFAAIHKLKSQFPQLYYFPSYELVIDDLRDYRFYNEDMIHPNRQAISYVWDRLMEVMFSKQGRIALDEVSAVIQAVKHRPRNPTGVQHQKFLQQTLQQIEKLKTTYHLDFEEEEKAIQTFLNV
ncbi:MAG: GSCFA domain-containing protein [Chitinophagales bacterium]